MQFVQQLVENLDARGAGAYHFVMDNAKIHHSPGLAEWIESTHKHKLKFLPSFSPFLNPVEECFSKLKNYVKKHPLDDQENLINRIQEGSYTITKQDCEGWVNHSISFFEKCTDLIDNL